MHPNPGTFTQTIPHTPVQVLDSSEYTVPGKAFAFVHDFAVTENYYVFYLNPITLDLKTFGLEYLWGKSSIAQCLKMTEGIPGKWYLVPRGPARAKGEKPKMLDVPLSITQFIFHHANAYEQVSGRRWMHDRCRNTVEKCIFDPFQCQPGAFQGVFEGYGDSIVPTPP